ncbi:MAG TPA: hypothetical protein VFZ68_06775 [Acidimicrobiales bacterium]
MDGDGPETHLSGTGEAPDDACPVCDASPAVLVGVRHPVMRRWTIDLLDAEHGCWIVEQPRPGELLAEAIERTRPALVVVDSADFPGCCQAALAAVPHGRVVVVGPEPDAAYRRLALSHGAGGWVCRDHVGEELSTAMRAALGCRHRPCPPETARRRHAAGEAPDLSVPVSEGSPP